MQLQTGVDIIEVNRIKEAIEAQGEKFLNHIFTPREIEYCSKTNKMQYQHYAARFAAKEAIFKAISSKIMPLQEDVWKKIEIVNDVTGKPRANLSAFGFQDIVSMDLSISHLKEYAIASFTILFK
ncbi:MAG: holo-ACP synthase [Clostridia bacterium]|nr:holo-ACP synthase [Clostridia bacterium]